jgi:hypothetical protein
MFTVHVAMPHRTLRPADLVHVGGDAVLFEIVASAMPSRAGFDR